MAIDNHVCLLNAVIKSFSCSGHLHKFPLAYYDEWQNRKMAAYCCLDSCNATNGKPIKIKLSRNYFVGEVE